jgi:chorismate mutase
LKDAPKILVKQYALDYNYSSVAKGVYMFFYALRGAITVDKNDSDEIILRTKELLGEIIKKNELSHDQFVSIIFTATIDLDAVYPAVAARELGMNTVPLICCQEMNTMNSLPKCIRLLIHVRAEQKVSPKHVYLRGAACLRPDLVADGDSMGGNSIG